MKNMDVLVCSGHQNKIAYSELLAQLTFILV
jgi:hypothetical protein